MDKYQVIDIEERRLRADQLEMCIFEFSKVFDDQSVNLVPEWAQKIRKIYANGYRHSYSRFFNILNKIHSNEKDYSIEFLFENLNLILQHIEEELIKERQKLKELGRDKKTKIERILLESQEYVVRDLFHTYSSFAKLIDHINLEESRCAEQRATEDKLEIVRKENQKLQEDNQKLQKELSAAMEKLEKADEKNDYIAKELSKNEKKLKKIARDSDEARKKIDRAQIDSVAVLGIFSTVVFAFSGGMTILGNVLSLMNRTAISKPTFYILLTGMILLNVLAVVVNSISNIIGLKRKQIDEEVEAACESDIQSADMTRNGFWKRLRSEHPVVVFGNIVLLLLMTVNIALWWWDIKCYSRFPFA